jgi:hypothetical protein
MSFLASKLFSSGSSTDLVQQGSSSAITEPATTVLPVSESVESATAQSGSIALGNDVQEASGEELNEAARMLQEVQKYLDLANLPESESAGDLDSAFRDNRLSADVELRDQPAEAAEPAGYAFQPDFPTASSAMNQPTVGPTGGGMEAELTQQLLEAQRQNFELKKEIGLLRFESGGLKSSKRGAMPKRQRQKGVDPLPEDQTDIFALWNTQLRGTQSAEGRAASGGDNRYGGSHHQPSRPAWGSPLKHPGTRSKPPLSTVAILSSPDGLAASRGKGSRQRPNVPPAVLGRKPYVKPVQAHRLLERRRALLDEMHEEAGRSCFPFTQGSAAGHGTSTGKESAGMLLSMKASSHLQEMLQKGTAQLMHMAGELNKRKSAESENVAMRAEVEQLRNECQQLRTHAQRGTHIQERHHDLVWEMQHLRQAHEEENMRLRQRLEELEHAKNMAMVQVEEAAILKSELEKYEQKIQVLETEKRKCDSTAQGRNNADPNMSAEASVEDTVQLQIANAQPVYVNQHHHSPHQLPTVQFDGEYVGNW